MSCGWHQYNLINLISTMHSCSLVENDDGLRLCNTKALKVYVCFQRSPTTYKSKTQLCTVNTGVFFSPWIYYYLFILIVILEHCHFRKMTMCQTIIKCQYKLGVLIVSCLKLYTLHATAYYKLFVRPK